jgi:hypothetical protein
MTPDQSSWMHKRWLSLLERLLEIVEVAKTMTRILERLTGIAGRTIKRVDELERRVAVLEGKEGESLMDGDWEAVAWAIAGRMRQLRATQAAVVQASGVSLSMLRELEHNIRQRRRKPETLAAISQALSWPPDYLERVLNGERPEPRPE